jgi:3-oxoacid CoA-transferase
MLPGKVKGIGGAMDLVSNPTQTKVVITMVSTNTPTSYVQISNLAQEHVDKKGRPKILRRK